MKLGVALSGGGIRGIAHAGVLKALEDNDIKVDIIGGTSSGGLVATMYALGYSPNYIYELFKAHAKEISAINKSLFLKGLQAYTMSKNLKIKGLNSKNSLESTFNAIARKKGVRKIKDIKMPLAITAVDIIDVNKYIFTNTVPKKSNSNYITDIEVGKAIRATSSFPGVFCPVNFEGHMFLDGGILDNIPVQEVRKQGATKVFAVNFAADMVDENSNMMDIIMKTIDGMGNKISEENLANCDFLLTVPTDKTGLLDVQKLEKCYKYGYNAVVDNLENIKKAIM